MRILILAILSIVSAAAFAAPVTTSSGTDVDRRVESILGQMTLEEKIDLLGGVDLFGVRGVPRLGVPSLTAADGPFGVRNFTRTTVIAGGPALAATWNSELAQRIGAQLGRDARPDGRRRAASGARRRGDPALL